MTTQISKGRARGFLASQEGLILLKKKKFELNLSYDDIAEKAELASVDQVKRLFNPHWKNSKVQADTVDRIARVLQLNPADIIEAENLDIETEDAELFKISPEPTGVLTQAIFNGIEAKTLKIGDVVQKGSRKGSVDQVCAANSKVESIVIGNVTQEA